MGLVNTVKITFIILLIVITTIWVTAYILNLPYGEITNQSINIDKDPIQRDTTVAAIPIHKGKDLHLHLIPQASYDISARVLSMRRYRGGWDGWLAPYDLALAWGNTGKDDYQTGIKYRQYGRFCQYSYNYDCKIAPEYIQCHMSNNHIISANKNILRAISKIKKMDYVRIYGYLIKLTGTYKSYPVLWGSSLVRTDTGDGACELIYVLKIQINNKEYE